MCTFEMYNRYQLPVFEVSNQVKNNRVCSATETCQKLENFHVAGVLSKRANMDCADEQAGLRLCCLHATKPGRFSVIHCEFESSKTQSRFRACSSEFSLFADAVIINFTKKIVLYG